MKKLLLILLLFVSVNCFSQRVISCSCSGDSDGDGISNCFDKCPNTPDGISVDTHGCPRDTDGDGIADYKDEQLITPSECQPSDEKGVGFCPEPECCYNAYSHLICGSNFGISTITFIKNSISLSSGANSQLEKLANAMRANPTFKVVVEGFDYNYTSYKGQQQAWDRVYIIIEYMTDVFEIDKERFIFFYGNPKKEDVVILRDPKDGEEGPCITPPPFPRFSKIKKIKPSIMKN